MGYITFLPFENIIRHDDPLFVGDYFQSLIYSMPMFDYDTSTSIVSSFTWLFKPSLF